MNAQLQALIGALGDTQVLDHVAQIIGLLDIFRGNPRNTFGKGFLKLERHAVGNRGQNRQLVRGVDTFYIKRGVGFGVAQRLGFREHVFKSPAFVAHVGKNVIAGAIDNARHPFDTVGTQAFAQ